MSCAALGSRTKVYDSGKARDIKTVGLITKRFDQPRNPYHKIIKEAFTRTLIEELEKKGLFEVVILDTMENEKLIIKSYVTNEPVDALLVADWKLNNPNNMVTDSKVQLTLLDKETKEVLLISRHGTQFGNLYEMTPALPKTLLDATEGAINSMEKNIKSKK
ncbi:MAG: hypothetical protein NVV82_13065 [Sporocytophaga sp.]|nr:hypothetical protein [Sporocytophaga sp.]